MSIPSYVKDYAARIPQLPIAGGWLVRYVREYDDVDRMVYCATEHDLAMVLSESYRRSHDQKQAAT